jgi:hypothetical protein
MRTVDSFLKVLGQSGKTLAAGDATRLAAVAEIIAARDGGEETNRWRAETLQRIRRSADSEDLR